MSESINRRKFVSYTGVSAAGIMLAGSLKGFSSKAKQAISPESGAEHSYNLMKDVMHYRKIDAHNHVYLYDGGPEGNIAFGDKLGIGTMVVSRPATTGEGTPKDIREYNDLVVKAMKLYPGRFKGEFTVNALHQKEALEEIKRCVDLGLVGLKVYSQVKINDPLFYPIIEKMIDLKMIILMHSNCQLGLGGYRMKYDTKIRPNTSIPEDFIDTANRYPELMLQYAHIGGGGDWEYACKLFKNHRNIYVDTSGSNNPENMVDFALQQLGEDRLFFGSDNCYYQSVGKILASNLTEAQKKKVFFENYNNILRKSGNHVD